MPTDIKQKHQLRKFIRQLQQHRGRHTELVSVYVPAGYDLNKIIQHLQQEQGTATNIKDARTRKNVIDSLEKAVRHLRLYKKTPENGLALFAGNVSDQEGKIDIQVFWVEPPEPLSVRMYRCDQHFITEPLEGMIEHKEVYGLIVMDRREANLGLLKGTYISQLATLTSGVPGKYKTGGQCIILGSLVQLADGNIIKIEDCHNPLWVKSIDLNKYKLKDSPIIDTWITKKRGIYKIVTKNPILIAETSKDHIFFVMSKSGIIEKATEELKVGDNLITTKNLCGEDIQLVPVKINRIEYRDIEAEMVDISVKNENFIVNGLLVHNSAARFSRIREGMAKEFYKRIADKAKEEFLQMKELKGIIIGGPGPTKYEFNDGDYLVTELKKKVIGIKDITYTDESGLNELVEKSKDLLEKEAITKEKKLMERFFEALGKSSKVAYGFEDVKKALEANAVDVLLISESLDEKLADELEDLAAKSGCQAEIISIDTREGQQLRDLGGVAALLRYDFR